ncbi:MAG: hypothetical protein E7413_04755 [Ruminococcaceae bacterium]|nr:hypothetical protein [Oscillospiraceae bacterium]
MNRNLKRVLSLALMMVVLAVNFVIPAFATEPISVSYTDLLSNTLTGGNGTLFFDTTPGNSTPSTGLDQGNYNRSYAPLEVWSMANRASLSMSASEWARFEVTAPTAGFYSVDATYGCGSTAGADFVIRTESTIIETHLAKSGQNAYSFTTATNLGYVYLAAGTNYIYADNKSSAVINFKGFDLTLDDTADATDVAWIAPIASANEIADLTVVFNDGYNQAEVGTVTFINMDIPVDGKYQVSVMGKATGSNTVSADFGGDAITATVSNDAYGYADIGVFPLTADTYTLTLEGFTDYSLAWVKVDYVSPYETDVESESFADGDTVARGTDNLTITFNDNMMDTAAATLSNDIPVEVTVDGAKVIVSFLETLAYETDYTLTVTGLQGVNDAEALEDKTYTFTTGDESADEGTDAVEVTDVTSSREDVTITGTVKGSTGKGIKGRTVTVTSPEGAEVATVTSGDNGVFTAEFTIADGTDAGAYTYTVTAEYGATTNAVVSYVSEAEELRILDLFLTATTPEAVYSIFESYGEILLVPNYATDCASLANDALFLGHFERKDFVAVRDVAPFYNKMLTLEGMNQATRGSDVDDYLTEEICDLLGIRSDKMDLIIKNDPGNSKKSSFAAKVAQDTNNNGASTSEAAFLERIATLLDAWLLETNNITATSLDLSEATTACRYAGEIAIPLDFTVAQSKVKSVVVTVTTAEAGLLANAQAVVDGLEPVDAVINGDTATFTIDFEYDAAKVYDEVGKISLQASVIATHDINVDATVIYRFTTQITDEEGNPADINVDMPIAVAGGTIRATVSPAQSSSPSRPTGNTGYVAPPKEKVEEEDDSNKSKYFFDDMGEALWAQDMVHELAAKGIISKNEERMFRPMDSVTREEYVKMLVTVIGSHKADAKSTLSDVSADHWATSYIATAQQLGIVQGNADGTFGLGQRITRQDMAVMLYRTFQVLGIDLPEGTNEFTDSNDIASYAKAAVSALEKQGIINGMGDGTFAPANNATRAQSAKVIYSMMEVLGV